MNMKLSLSSALALVPFILAGGFSQTCSAPAEGFNTLTATCRTISGGIKTSSVDLTSCLANKNGVLTCGRGFQSSCHACGMGGHTLSCLCSNDAGSIDNTSINLDDCVSNLDGQLACP